VARVPEPVWREASALAGRIGATSAFAAGLRLVPDGGELAQRLGLPASTSVGDALHVASAPAMAYSLEWVAGGPLPLHRKAAFVGRKLFPPAEYLRSVYPVARRGRLGLTAARALRLGSVVRRLPAATRAFREARRSARSG
jgi:hypothetical protein